MNGPNRKKPALPAGFCVVTFESPSPGLTKVHLRHLGFAEAAAHAAAARQIEQARAQLMIAWNMFLDQLVKRFEEK